MIVDINYTSKIHRSICNSILPRIMGSEYSLFEIKNKRVYWIE